MENLFVSYEQAIKLKKLGFSEKCFTFYFEYGEMYNGFLYTDHNEDFSERISAPLKQQVLRWFREKYNIIGLIEGGFDMTNIFTYCIWEGFKDKIYDDYYGTYEEAEDVLINILIDKLMNETK
jgi:hypothetical protein